MSASSPLDVRLAAFYSSLESLCRAAGPPAPSFSLTDLDKAIEHILDRVDLYPSVFSAIDYRLSCDSSQTALSVRAMLWNLIVRMMERTMISTQTPAATANTTMPASAATHTVPSTKKGDEWSTLLAPQLYRLVMSIVPRQEDATANVQLTKQQLLKWMNQAEQNATTAPFKRHQLVNALKYVEGYVYEPPPLTEEEKAEYKRRRKAKKRRERELEESRRRKKKRKREKQRDASKANGESADSPLYSPGQSPAKSISDNESSADDDVGMSDSPHSHSGSSGDDSDGGRSDSTERRHARRLQISHTASEGAEASRLLELLRASQKRAQVEGVLRPQGESKQSWEEMEEIRQHFRQKRELKRLEAAAAASSGSGSSSSAAPPAGSVHSFLASWLSTRNHWKATRDCEHDGFDERFDGGRHELDEWIRYFESNQQPLPSAIISHGATRMWSRLNEQPQQNHLHQHAPKPLLPLPAPSRLYANSSSGLPNP